MDKPVLLLVTLGIAAVAVPFRAAAQAGETARTRARVVSDVEGLTFTWLNNLPNRPGSDKMGELCEGYVIKSTSQAGKVVASHGWVVTGEAKIGSYQAVSFAGKLEFAGSGACSVEQGNIGFFDGATLVALIYAPKLSKKTIGAIKPLEGGGIRVWDGDPLSVPSGDIQLTQDGSLRLGKGRRRRIPVPRKGNRA